MNGASRSRAGASPLPGRKRMRSARRAVRRSHARHRGRPRRRPSRRAADPVARAPASPPRIRTRPHVHDDAGRRPRRRRAFRDGDDSAVHLEQRWLSGLEELQRDADETLRRRPGNQDAPVHRERTSVEFPLPRDVRHGLVLPPPADSPLARRDLRFQLVVRVRQQPAPVAPRPARGAFRRPPEATGNRPMLLAPACAYHATVTTIGIDCRFAASHSGLGRYTRELVPALLERGGAHYALFVRSESEAWIPRVRSVLLAACGAVPALLRAGAGALSGLIRRAGIDLLFSPHFNVPLLCPVPFVTTIHDLILHRYPNNAGPWKQAAYRLLLHNAVSRPVASCASARSPRTRFDERTAGKRRGRST